MSQTAEALVVLLQDELATLEALDRILDQEHAALIEGDPQALEDLTARKNNAIDAHRQQQQRRLTWMGSAGLMADTPLETVVQQAGDTQEARTAQQRLMELAEACQTKNRNNGGLIARLQERARGALGVLRRDDSGNLYSLSGAPEQHSDSRSLGKA